MKTTKSTTALPGQRAINGLLGLAFAALILFQAGDIKSEENAMRSMSIYEVEVLSDIEQMFLEEAEQMKFEEEMASEESQEIVKIFGNNNELIAQGSTEGNPALRLLVNQADLLSVNGGTKYFRIAK